MMGSRIDFHINVRPYSIDFECPHCKYTAEIRWTDLCVPDYWGDDWGAVECPECGEYVVLGDYDYD